MARLARILIYLAISLSLLVPIGFGVSSQLSLDRDYAHSARTEGLPVLSSGTCEGLVRIPARGFEFRARVAGLDRVDGPALILLHGFPQTSIMWEPLVVSAASVGFRVVAFDQRGYSPGARPETVGAYQISELVADLFAVADAVGFDRFHLVGHDWGAVVGWVAAGQDSERVLSYAALSIPHPGALGAANAEQGTPLYIKFFQLPGVAEALLTAGGLAALRGMYGEMPEDHVEEYVGVFSEPGALRSALNWYRAMASLAAEAGSATVSQPAIWVFGNRDMPVFVRPDVQAHQERFVTGSYEAIELDAGHWLMQEEPGRVVWAVMDHLRANATP
jgi:pimeloyl-ACP methyl ester carboxylesterase